METKVCNGFRVGKVGLRSSTVRKQIINQVNDNKMQATAILNKAGLGQFTGLLNKVDDETINSIIKLVSKLDTGYNPLFCFNKTVKSKKNHKNIVKFLTNNLDVSIVDIIVKAFLGIDTYNDIINQINIEFKTNHNSLNSVLKDPKLDKDEMMKRFYEDIEKKIKKFNSPKNIMRFAKEASANLKALPSQGQGMQNMQGQMPQQMQGMQGQMPPQMQGMQGQMQSMQGQMQSMQGQMPPQMQSMQGQMPLQMQGMQGQMLPQMQSMQNMQNMKSMQSMQGMQNIQTNSKNNLSSLERQAKADIKHIERMRKARKKGGKKKKRKKKTKKKKRKRKKKKRKTRKRY